MVTDKWWCDVCKLSINSPDRGNVEWVEYTNESGAIVGRDLRLVHHAMPDHKGCMFDTMTEFKRDKGVICDYRLDRLLSPDGLTLLLNEISEGTLPKESVIEMIQRLHVPGYESARPHFEAAIAAGAIDPNLPRGFHWQRDIEEVIDWAKANA